MPLPERWFVSPLKRAGETCGIEWGWLFSMPKKERQAGKGHGMKAIVVENLRERLHVHQCDERSSRSALQLDFPLFEYTTGTAEEDELWQPQETRGRKTEDELTTRSGGGMDQVLDVSEGATFISITSHPGALWGVYKILGVPPKSLVVGEMNVLVLRVKKVTE
ncbi:hypothetical protein L202_00351 [Cryptococcus amylolentus CBS 6039]|uniref:Uncharacterized protein n=1 Tax=Cryptococcus amylolentus CBS 6039 TaxID=1295533 RepID=A0A1E3I9C6_9TREE|nr:hypothetical protein L202_00351 [Cryptococcus amylolentus CBS 6039]ODN84391.1 hypothetical protein L202_00351 [Cryptococcus amylolentus CBS 6039]